MAETTLTQIEADTLLAMEKHRTDDTAHTFPVLGGAIVVPLISANKRENFLLDVTRGRINLKKVTYQNRARTAVILARLDIAGPPHVNPDGQEIPCPHLHTYREGFGDKWAEPHSRNISVERTMHGVRCTISCRSAKSHICPISKTICLYD